MKALLALENGMTFDGISVGADGETSGEVVFNTSLTGYQEVLTDPSYAGQIVTMTAPQIGNYGVSDEDVESRRTSVAGFVVREASPIASNWRADGTLADYLRRNGIVAIAEIDTRALTRVLRSAGVMRGVIATGASLDPAALVDRARRRRADGRRGLGPGRHVRAAVRVDARGRRRRGRRPGGTGRVHRPCGPPREGEPDHCRL